MGGCWWTTAIVVASLVGCDGTSFSIILAPVELAKVVVNSEPI
jgi:hypothetical protein